MDSLTVFCSYSAPSRTTRKRHRGSRAALIHAESGMRTLPREAKCSITVSHGVVGAVGTSMLVDPVIVALPDSIRLKIPLVWPADSWS